MSQSHGQEGLGEKETEDGSPWGGHRSLTPAQASWELTTVHLKAAGRKRMRDHEALA